PGELGARVEAEVAGGRPLAEALALFPDEVPREDVALLEAGEATGNLDRILDRLAERHDARSAARRRFLTDIWYPLILFHLAALFTPIPSSFGRDGRLFGPSWISGVLWILVPAYAIVLGAMWLSRRARGRDLLRRVVDVLPGFGSAARHRRRGEFADVLGAAYEAGVRMDRALSLAGGAVGDPRIEVAVAAVARGSTLRDALAGTGFLPQPLLARLAIGEQAGEITKSLAGIAREEAEAAEHVLRRTTTLLSKLVYLAVAAWILLYYVSTMLGIYAPFLR
ncbi:MAG: type II secretion system F family protein, partial [Planctomycetes bacterium]|nr:type II secretion system F family protein [Planctomycetota bacterium]